MMVEEHRSGVLFRFVFMYNEKRTLNLCLIWEVGRVIAVHDARVGILLWIK